MERCTWTKLHANITHEHNTPFFHSNRPQPEGHTSCTVRQAPSSSKFACSSSSFSESSNPQRGFVSTATQLARGGGGQPTKKSSGDNKPPKIPSPNPIVSPTPWQPHLYRYPSKTTPPDIAFRSPHIERKNTRKKFGLMLKNRVITSEFLTKKP